MYILTRKSEITDYFANIIRNCLQNRHWRLQVKNETWLNVRWIVVADVHESWHPVNRVTKIKYQNYFSMTYHSESKMTRHNLPRAIYRVLVCDQRWNRQVARHVSLFNANFCMKSDIPWNYWRVIIQKPHSMTYKAIQLLGTWTHWPLSFRVILLFVEVSIRS